MPRNDRRQLEWVLKNRARGDHAARAGTAVERVVTTVEQRGLGPALDAAKALRSVVDDEFRRHCRVAGAVDGKVTIHVDAAPLVSAMRMKWLSAVREELGTADRRWGRGTIAFTFGQSGVEVPPA